jgi:hypothetical protein
MLTVKNADMDKTLISKNNIDLKKCRMEKTLTMVRKGRREKKPSNLYTRELKYFFLSDIFLTI